MAKRSRMSMQKRQREIKKAEKAARKRAKRHGLVLETPEEPAPTFGADALFGPTPAEAPDIPEETPAEEEKEDKEQEG